MPRRKKIEIDPDLLEATAEYVQVQMAIMANHGSLITLSPEAVDDLVYRVAAHPQECRNLQKKLDAKSKLRA